jgi:hypothetical protein
MKRMPTSPDSLKVTYGELQEAIILDTKWAAQMFVEQDISAHCLQPYR